MRFLDTMIPSIIRESRGFNWLRLQKVTIRHHTRLLRAYVYDYRRYRRYSTDNLKQQDESSNLSAMIILNAHCIEKAFSLPEIRPGYGEERISELVELLRRYQNLGYDREGFAFQKAQSVLAEYIRYHDRIAYDLGDRKDEILPWVDMTSEIGGYISRDREDLLQRARGDFRECALSRFSIRDYTKELIPHTTIIEAIEIACKTPSVCNRQPWHVYIIQEEALKAAVLELQGGSHGFGDRAAFLAVITTDIRAFTGAGERNEAYVDGGLFSMSLLYALHYMKIGACALNWMVEPPKDRKMRDLLSIESSEIIVMIVAAGRIPETVRISKSARKTTKSFVTFYK